MKRAVLDFESEAIDQRPKYPPKPVGLAFKLPGQPYTYASWGHASGNGVYYKRGAKTVKSKEMQDPKRIATLALKKARECDSILGHNIAKFDADLSEMHMGVKLPDEKIDDSLFSRFLADPHAPTLSLKPSAERVLGEAPEERDAVFDWLYQHGIIPKPKTDHGVLKYSKNAGAFISKAPGDLVAAYAIGDLTRSEHLFDHDWKIIKAAGMEAAYLREQKVAPILLANERQGIRVDVPRLAADEVLYTQALKKVETWLRKKIGSVENFDSDADVAAALRKSGTVKIFPKTATGKDSVSKSRLTAEFFSNPDVYRAMVYRDIVAYVLSQNIRPWLETAMESGGQVYTIWNQVRSDKEGGGGARSGRITCSKLGNIIKNPTGGKNPDYLKTDDERIRKLVGLPELPLARKYILPDEGGLFIHRDWSQQEIRITAHYEEAELAAAYIANPAVDIHKYATDLIDGASGATYERDVIKHVNLRAFYGGGADGLIIHPMLRLDKKMGCKLGCSHSQERCAAWKAAQEIMRNWRKGLPGVVNLMKRLSDMYRRGEPIRTFGGRVYHCKPPAVAQKGPRKGQMVTFEYTGLNYLVQPSAADLLKMAIINYDEHPKRRGRMLCVVHDEINSSAPKKLAKQENKVLEEVMHAVKIDVPWRSDGDERINWQEKEKI